MPFVSAGKEFLVLGIYRIHGVHILIFWRKHLFGGGLTVDGRWQLPSSQLRAALHGNGVRTSIQ